MRTFDISIARDTVAVKQGEEAILTFTVTNVSGRDLRALVKLVPENDEHIGWLGVEGEGRREVENAQSDTIVVKIRPPREAPTGAGKFRLIVASEENPDEDFAEAVAQFTVEPGAAPEPRPRRWWLIAAAAGAVVAVVVLAVLLWPKAEVYAITDVVVIDASHPAYSEDTLREYTGVSRDQLTAPYIPEHGDEPQVGKRVTASNVNEDMPYYPDDKKKPGFGSDTYRGRATSIWVKYERLPKDSDTKVLVDIAVCSWEKEVPEGENRWDSDDPDAMKWQNDPPMEEGWERAHGYSMETNHRFLYADSDEPIEGGLTTGLPWQIYRKGLEVKYMVLEDAIRDAIPRIMGLHLASTPQKVDRKNGEVEYLPAQEGVEYDVEGKPLYDNKRAGVDIYGSSHPSEPGCLFLMKHVVPPSDPPEEPG
jgi:hypothetical protein